MRTEKRRNNITTLSIPNPQYYNPQYIMRSIDKIIVHCTATPEGKHFTVQQIREWHTAPKPKGNGWRDIGYHFVVYLDGSVHNGRPVGQI